MTTKKSHPGADDAKGTSTKKTHAAAPATDARRARTEGADALASAMPFNAHKAGE
jgi:hypothetical protein